MRLIFAGSGAFGAVVLNALHRSPHTVCQVLSQPDRPAGRRLKLHATAVAQTAREMSLPLLQPERLNDDLRSPLQAHRADALIVVDYGRLIPASWLNLCPAGALNIHASMLPRWRGAAPIARAIEAGDSHGGCTLMLMDEHLDSGDILMQEALPFAGDETTASARGKLAELGARLLLDYLDDLDPSHPRRLAQNPAESCLAPALRKQEAPIDWSDSAERLSCKIRAFNPQPVATTRCGDETLRLWQAHALPEMATEAPGHVQSLQRDGIQVACGEGQLCITELQRPGAKRLSARDFCNARDLGGMRLT